MSDIGPEGRSYLTICRDDLERLADIARGDRNNFFAHNHRWAELYESSVICTALCQGAAAHYIDLTTGVNDFDVYTFFRRHPQKGWYSKRIKSYDFGNPKFGTSTDRPNFVGRRVDCIGRALEASGSEDVRDILCRYLRQGKTKTARLLAEKAVVLLEPNCGEVIWPIRNRV